MKYFELSPIRITSGWTMKYNNFTEYDPEQDGAQYCYELNEDLILLENQNLIIDLGWYPAMNLKGCYIMYLVDKNRENPFLVPLDRFQTKSKKEIISKLEYWMSEGHYQKYIQIYTKDNA